MIDMDREALHAWLDAWYLPGVAVLLLTSLLIVIATTAVSGRAKRGQELALPLVLAAGFWPLIAGFALVLSPVALMYVAAWATARITRR